MLGQATGNWTHLTHHGPDSREAPTFPLIVFFAPLHRGYIEVALFPGTPKLESRNCPETVPSGVPGLWELITPDCIVGSWRGLNQSCNPPRALSNDLSHSQIGCREEVDSRLLVVGSQTASLIPGLSFAHNLGCRCPNGQCEAIFDIYASRPLQWHQEHLNARCFGPCCWTLNIRESQRTPNPQLWKCWASPTHLAKVGLRHATSYCFNFEWARIYLWWICSVWIGTYLVGQQVYVPFNLIQFQILYGFDVVELEYTWY